MDEGITYKCDSCEDRCGKNEADGYPLSFGWVFVFRLKSGLTEHYCSRACQSKGEECSKPLKSTAEAQKKSDYEI